jgi:hypothetical protein
VSLEISGVSAAGLPGLSARDDRLFVRSLDLVRGGRGVVRGCTLSAMRKALFCLGRSVVPAGGGFGRRGVVAALLAGLGVAMVMAAPSMSASNPVLNVNFSAQGSASVTLADGTPVGSTSGAPTVISAGYYAISLSGPPASLGLINFAGPGVSLHASLDPCADGATYEAYFAPNSTYTWRNPDSPAVVGTFATSSVVVGTRPPSMGSPSPAASTPGSSEAVGNQGLIGSAASAATTVPFRGQLRGSVSSSGSLNLTFKAKHVVRLLAGNYTITITDRSARKGFILQENLQPPVTISGLGFVGKRAMTVDLSAGQWSFAPSILDKGTNFTVSS